MFVTVYGHNLQTLGVLVHGKAFHPSIMFASKARANHNGAPEMCSTLG
jgi:hypothetical protein